MKEIDIPDVDVPLAHFEELDSADGVSNSSNSNERKQKKSTMNLEEDKSSSTSTSISANLSSSLQDLVESFDKNVSTVLKDMNKDAEQIAPVKIRSREEIMSESQFWWTLTGNYGNLPPIDFDRSVIRRKQLEVLGLQLPKDVEDTPTGTDRSFVSDDDEEGSEGDDGNMNFHQVVTTESHLIENGEVPPFSAERVIEEIDEILQAGDFMNQSLATNRTMESVDSMYSSMRSPNVYPDTEPEFTNKQQISVSAEEMGSFSQSKLITIVSEMEQIIQLYNEELVRELARRDEFEYEKEVRNKFITLLVAVQERRRKLISGKRKGAKEQQTGEMANNNLASVAIPFDDSQEAPDARTLEALIKILQAVVDDSAQLPAFLTDYILNVICPTKPSATHL